MSVKVPTNNNRYWNISSRGAAEIAELRKRLLAFSEKTEQARLDLMGAVVEYGEGLGIYRDGLENGLAELEKLNVYAKESVELLEKRIGEFEQALRDELGIISLFDLFETTDTTNKK